MEKKKYERPRTITVKIETISMIAMSGRISIGKPDEEIPDHAEDDTANYWEADLQAGTTRLFSYSSCSHTVGLDIKPTLKR